MTYYDAENQTYRSGRITGSGTIRTVVHGANIQHAHAVTPGATQLAGVNEFGPCTMVYGTAAGSITLTLASDGTSLTIPTVNTANSWEPIPAATHITASTITGLIAGY